MESICRFQIASPASKRPGARPTRGSGAGGLARKVGALPPAQPARRTTAAASRAGRRRARENPASRASVREEAKVRRAESAVISWVLSEVGRRSVRTPGVRGRQPITGGHKVFRHGVSASSISSMRAISEP